MKWSKQRIVCQASIWVAHCHQTWRLLVMDVAVFGWVVLRKWFQRRASWQWFRRTVSVCFFRWRCCSWTLFWVLLALGTSFCFHLFLKKVLDEVVAWLSVWSAWSLLLFLHLSFLALVWWFWNDVFRVLICFGKRIPVNIAFLWWQTISRIWNIASLFLLDNWCKLTLYLAWVCGSLIFDCRLSWLKILRSSLRMIRVQSNFRSEITDCWVMTSLVCGRFKISDEHI